MASIKDMVRDLMLKKKKDFLSGIDYNGERKAFEFFISEITNEFRSDSVLIRPSQLFGILALYKEKIPDIKHKIRCDYPPSNNNDLFDEGQIWLDLTWEGEFPGTSSEPTCFI